MAICHVEITSGRQNKNLQQFFQNLRGGVEVLGRQIYGYETDDTGHLRFFIVKTSLNRATVEQIAGYSPRGDSFSADITVTQITARNVRNGRFRYFLPFLQRRLKVFRNLQIAGPEDAPLG